MEIKKSVGKYISIMSRQFQIYANFHFKEFNIASSEYVFLMNIPLSGAVSQKEICEIFCIDQAMATRSLKKMEKKGLVKRQKKESDHREYQVSLTAKGKDLQPKIKEKLVNWTNILTKGIAEDEQEKLFEQMSQMADNARKEIEDLKSTK